MNAFQQLYDIITNAVFGDAVLTSSQQFLCEQLATWGAVATVLLPCIVLVCLTFKLLRW